MIYRASMIPGPSDYNPQEVPIRGGVKFSDANPKSDLDWTIYNAKNRPGPGTYNPDSGYKIKGGRFSTSRPKSDVEWTIYRAKQIPGPGAYGISRDLTSVTLLAHAGAGIRRTFLWRNMP